MQAFKVVGRPHRRISINTQPAVAADGTRFEIPQQGPLTTYAVGDVIEDIRRDELEAFPDRFVPATSAEVDAWHRKQAELPTIMRAPGLSAEQAVEHANLTRQIEELQAKQQALMTDARTPVPMQVEEGTPGVLRTSEPPPGRRSENRTPGAAEADAPGHMSVPGQTTPAAETAPTAPTTPPAHESSTEPSGSRRR